jgi:hypothetical protein
MSLTEKIEIDKIEIVNNWVIQVRQATTVYKDGEELAKTFHRWVLTPDMNINNQEQKVQDIATAAWTPEVRQAYEAFKTEQDFIAEQAAKIKAME